MTKPPVRFMTCKSMKKTLGDFQDGKVDRTKTPAKSVTYRKYNRNTGQARDEQNCVGNSAGGVYTAKGCEITTPAKLMT